FTNLVITPVIGIVILPAALFSSFVFLLSGSFPLCSLIDGFTAFILASIRQIARWNFAAVRIPAFPPLLLITFYAGLLLFVILKGGNVLSATRNESKEKEDSKNSSLITRHASRFLLPFSIAVIPFLIYAGFRMIGHKGLRVTYLDVGQGDAAVAELPDGRVLALDTGRNGSQTAAFLRYRGVGAIGALVLSHGQSDHSGGVGYLRDNFIINGIWDNNRLVYPRDLVRGIPHRGLERGDIIRGDGYVIEALHPYTGFYMSGPKDADENNDSLVLRIRGKKAAFLFTGDIEQTGAEDIAHLGAYLKSTVLKVPHHGSRSSLSEPFLKMVAPEAAVISVGRENPFGHPHDEVIEALRGTRIFRTDRDGAIGIRECPDGSLEIKTWRDFQFSEAGTLNDEFMNLKRLFWVW
ncbi:MAG TPA: ComEC/Rec2 family competence protein, partial [Dissulfurispiraceae bacterium]